MLPLLYSAHGIEIFSYPLFLGIAWGVGIQLAYPRLLAWFNTKFRVNLWLVGLFLISWLGAKLLFLFNLPTNQSDNLHWSFWLGGGFVFWGGFLFALLFSFITSYVLNFPFEKFSSLWPVLMISHGIGRIGCFLAGCCHGHELESGHWLRSWNVNHFPVQLIESSFLILVGSIYHRRLDHNLNHYFILYGSFRFLIEFLRADTIRGQWGMFSPSQWIGLILVVIALIPKPLKLFR